MNNSENDNTQKGEVSPDPVSKQTTNKSDSNPTKNKTLRRTISKRINHKPRFTQGALAHKNESLPKSVLTRPVKPVFQIHTNTKYLYPFIETVHNIILKRDVKIGNAISLSTLTYVTFIAMYHRLALIALKHGNFNAITYSFLKVAAESLLLPEPLCKLIETFGVVKDANECSYVPYFPSESEMREKSSPFISLVKLRNRACPLPIDILNLQDSVDYGTVSDYIQSTSRGFKAQILFRKCDFDNLEGKAEFLTGYSKSAQEITAWTSNPMAESLAQMGASYRMRNVNKRNLWLGPDNDKISFPCLSTRFNIELFLSSKLVTDADGRQ